MDDSATMPAPIREQLFPAPPLPPPGNNPHYREEAGAAEAIAEERGGGDQQPAEHWLARAKTLVSQLREDLRGLRAGCSECLGLAEWRVVQLERVLDIDDVQ